MARARQGPPRSPVARAPNPSKDSPEGGIRVAATSAARFPNPTDIACGELGTVDSLAIDVRAIPTDTVAQSDCGSLTVPFRRGVGTPPRHPVERRIRDPCHERRPPVRRWRRADCRPAPNELEVALRRPPDAALKTRIVVSTIPCPSSRPTCLSARGVYGLAGGAQLLQRCASGVARRFELSGG